MSLAATVLLGLAAGGAIGALYFAWLWWSLRALVDRRQGGIRFAAHVLARYALAVAGFALVTGGLGWQGAAAALGGFAGARLLMQRRLGGAGGPPEGPA